MGDRLKRFGVYSLLIFWVAAVVFPLLWIGLNSLRSSQEFTQNPFGIPWIVTGAPEGFDADPAQAAVNNYANAWEKSHFRDFFVNSVVVVSLSLAGVIALATLASYALARLPIFGARTMYVYFISGMMIPAPLVLIPLFFQFTTIGEWGSALLRPFGFEFVLHDTLTGLILIYIAFSLPFTILVLTGFFRSLPSALRESAIVDGCSEWEVFWHIMLPLARPGLVTAAIFNFVGLWNEYLFALVFIHSEETKTLPLGLASVSMQAQYKTDFGLLFAGLVIVIVPTLLVYLVLQNRLTKGITVGALKG